MLQNFGTALSREEMKMVNGGFDGNCSTEGCPTGYHCNYAWGNCVEDGPVIFVPATPAPIIVKPS